MRKALKARIAKARGLAGQRGPVRAPNPVESKGKCKKVSVLLYSRSRGMFYPWGDFFSLLRIHRARPQGH